MTKRDELTKELAEIDAELARPKKLQIRREQIHNELAQLDQANHGIEFVCLGAKVKDSTRDFSTVVVRDDDSIIVLPLAYHFTDGSEAEVGLSQADYVRANTRGRVLHGGRLNIVSKDLARNLIKAGCHVTTRQAVPTVVYGDRSYAVANPTV